MDHSGTIYFTTSPSNQKYISTCSVVLLSFEATQFILEKMKLTVKTLKGGKFQVDCEGSNTVLEVKGIIVSNLRIGMTGCVYEGNLDQWGTLLTSAH